MLALDKYPSYDYSNSDSRKHGYFMAHVATTEVLFSFLQKCSFQTPFLFQKNKQQQQHKSYF